MNKNKIILISIAVICVLIIISFLSINYLFNKKIAEVIAPNKEDTPDVIEKTPDMSLEEQSKNTAEQKKAALKAKIEKEDEIYTIAKNEKKPEKCNELEDQDRMSLCFRMLAISLIDKKLCDNTGDEKEKKDCYNLVVNQEAFSKNDIKKCNEIRDNDLLYNSCVINIVEAKEYTISQCENIDESKIKNICLSHILLSGANNISSCSNIPLEANRQECEGMFN